MTDEIRKYFASLPPDARKVLKRIRDDIRTAAPAAVEHFSYGIPAFKLDGQSLVWYAAFKKHVSIYPMREAIRRKFGRELQELEFSKGTIRFPLSAPPSSTLVKKLVKARIAEVRAGR
jgi:uncharacterized protein YdhG (YjbR/CyaY superfamily)